MKKYLPIILVALVVIIVGALCWIVVYRPTQTQFTSGLLTSADVTVGSGYFLSGGKIFFYTVSTSGPTPADWKANPSEVVGADPITFSILKDPHYVNRWESGGYEAKDANHLYSQSEALSLVGPAASKIDLQTLSKVAPGVFKDKNAIYIINGSSVTEVQSADPATFVALADPTYGSASTYAKDKNSVYFLEGGYNPDLTATVIPGIDPNTFKVIGRCSYSAEPSGAYGDEYNAIDATHVLAGKDVVPGADQNTFKIVGEIQPTTEYMSSVATVYAVDKNHVYKRCSEIVTGVSPAQCTANNLKGCENQTL